MRILFLTIMLILSTTRIAATEPVHAHMHVIDIEEQDGAITASFSLTGTTVLPDESQHPQVSPVDQLKATLIITTPETMHVELPQFHTATFGDFTLIEQGKISRQRTKTAITTTISWLIEPCNEGSYSLPPLVIKGTTNQNELNTFTLHLPDINVIPLPATTGNFDILPPRPIRKNNLWLILAITAGSIIILFILIKVLKAKRRPKPLSPKQQAFVRLEQLHDTTKEKTEALSLLIRQFLDHNFNMRTVEKTYAEYKPFIKKHPQIHDNDLILQILKTCDQSNYSGTPLAEEELLTITQQAHDFIENCAEPIRPDEDTETCGRW